MSNPTEQNNPEQLDHLIILTIKIALMSGDPKMIFLSGRCGFIIRDGSRNF
jgi:hypothetical protein